MIELENEFEQIRLARLYKVHGNYDLALGLYFEILDGVNNECEAYPYLLLEYAVCLLESAMTTCEENYVEVFEKKRNKLNTTEEDVEYAWNCLENARMLFEELQNKNRLICVHKYTGDLLVFNNDFAQALLEYEKAQNMCEENEHVVEVLEDICECYVHLKDFEKAKECYKNILGICKEEDKNYYTEAMNGLQITS